MNISMVDLKAEYTRLKPEIDDAISKVINSTAFINGPEVSTFADSLSRYLDINYTIPCANGTDALQLALMALQLPKESEVLVPSFNYVAAAEVLPLLGLVPVFVDSDPHTFNLDITSLENSISEKSRAVIAVHLFGQCCDLEPILHLCKKHNLILIEDNAQSLGAEYFFKDGKSKKAGTVGALGTTSFFPSKVLGCFGDGGAVFTNDKALAERIRMIANHGQRKKYAYEMVGINSRLDTIQAAILSVKLKYLDQSISNRRKAAERYSSNLNKIKGLEVPVNSQFSTHVYHQYTVKVKEGRREEVKQKLFNAGIPSMVYYPEPLHLQKAYKVDGAKLTWAEKLPGEVLSLPIHPDLKNEEIDFITGKIIEAVKG